MKHMTDEQRQWLSRGLDRPGGKLPIFDGHGQHVRSAVTASCIENGWVSEWQEFGPWTVYILTDTGRATLHIHNPEHVS